MKKLIRYAATAALVVILAAGCGVLRTDGTLSLSLGSSSKAIAPTNLVDHYDLVLSKDGGSLKLTIDKPTTTVFGMDAGLWNIDIEGLDKNDVLIASGAGSVEIYANETAYADIPLAYADLGIGTGSLALTIQIPNPAHDGVYLDTLTAAIDGVELNPLDINIQPVTRLIEGETVLVRRDVQLTQSELEGGVHELTIAFKTLDGENFATMLETLLVVPGSLTAAVWGYSSTQACFGPVPEEPGDVFFKPGTANELPFISWTPVKGVYSSRDSNPSEPLDPQGYRVTRDLDGEESASLQVYLGAYDSCWSDSYWEPNQAQFRYKLCAFNQYGESGEIELIQPSALKSIKNLGYNKNGENFSFYWSAVSIENASYNLYARLANDSTLLKLNASPITSLPFDTTLELYQDYYLIATVVRNAGEFDEEESEYLNLDDDDWYQFNSGGSGS